MAFEHHILLIIIKKLWGGPFEDQNAHSRFSGSNGSIAVNTYIENTNVVCLLFWIFPFDVNVSKFILPKICSVIYFFTTKLVHIRVQTSHWYNATVMEVQTNQDHTSDYVVNPVNQD